MAHFRPEKGGWYLSSQHINSKVKILLLDSRAGLWPAFGDHFCSNNPEFSASEKFKKVCTFIRPCLYIIRPSQGLLSCNVGIIRPLNNIAVGIMQNLQGTRQYLPPRSFM